MDDYRGKSLAEIEKKETHKLLRRRIEDYLRKYASISQLREVARILGIKE